jgi:adenine-specific DNA-methyltransferase
VNRLGGGAWAVHYHSSEVMPEIEDSTAQFVIGSPPFTNHSDGRTLNKSDYLNFVRRVFCESFRVLAPGSLLVSINTDLRDHARYNDGDNRFNGLLWQKHCAIRGVAESIGFRCIDTKIWAKTRTRNVYRYTFAYIQFFQKAGAKVRSSLRGKVTARFAPDVWLLEGGTNRRDSQGQVFRDAFHPEIVSRCLEQFTAPGDLVISPFAGSGTVVSVAKLMGRRCVGYEVNRKLRRLILESIATPEQFPAYLGLSSGSR